MIKAMVALLLRMVNRVQMTGQLDTLIGLALEFFVAVMVFVRLYMHIVDLLSITRKYKNNPAELRAQRCKYLRRRRSLYGSVFFAI